MYLERYFIVILDFGSPHYFYPDYSRGETAEWLFKALSRTFQSLQLIKEGYLSCRYNYELEYDEYSDYMTEVVNSTI